MGQFPNVALDFYIVARYELLGKAQYTGIMRVLQAFASMDSTRSITYAYGK